MIDVHGGITREPLVEEIDHGLERGALLRAVVRPDRVIAVRAVESEEEVQTARRLPERIAFDVEDQIAR